MVPARACVVEWRLRPGTRQQCANSLHVHAVFNATRGIIVGETSSNALISRTYSRSTPKRRAGGGPVPAAAVAVIARRSSLYACLLCLPPCLNENENHSQPCSSRARNPTPGVPQSRSARLWCSTGFRVRFPIQKNFVRPKLIPRSSTIRA